MKLVKKLESSKNYSLVQLYTGEGCTSGRTNYGCGNSGCNTFC